VETEAGICSDLGHVGGAKDRERREEREEREEQNNTTPYIIKRKR
jgi:hypothetical protein